MGVRERYIGSIEYLRKMGFFEDYSNLTSEEIFEKIRRGETGRGEFDYEEVEEDEKWKEWLEWFSKHGWLRDANTYADYTIATYDPKRVLEEDAEMFLSKELGVELLEKIARISRGAFEPTDVKRRRRRRHGTLSWYEVEFNFREEKHFLQFFFSRDYWRPEIFTLLNINEMIEDTGYQYYGFPSFGQEICLVVLTEGEAEKLEKERGWSLWKPKVWKPSELMNQ